MPHPTVQEPVTTLVFGATWAALLAHVPPDLVFGAFGGATIYLLGVKDKPKWQWAVLFSLSFMAGIMGGPMVCQLVEGMLGLAKLKVSVPKGLGAMAAAATTVNVLSWLRDNPKSLVFWKKEAQS